MQAEPLPLNAHLQIVPTAQRIDLVKLDGAHWMLVIMQPLATHAVLLDQPTAMALSNQLREQCGGLTIARDVPPANGAR